MSYANITNPANFQLQDFAQFGFRVITTDFIPVPGEQYRTLYVLQDAVVTATTQKGDDITSKAILAGTLLHGLFNSVSITSGRVLAYAAGRVTADEIIALYEAYVVALGGTLENTQCAIDAINEEGVDLFADASLVMIPEGYGTGVVYGQRPLTSDSQLTFTRASDATRVGPDGAIAVVGSNVPRLDYLGSSCPRLLLEPQRSNLVLFSEQMNVWTNGTASVTANATTSPDGYQNADSINNTADVSTFVGASNVAHTFSLFVKQGTSATASIDMSDGATGDVITTFTFATKTFSGTSAGGSWTSPSTAYQDYGNGWYRISLTATKGAGSEIGYKIIASGTGTTFVWGAQLEQGYASSYINTLGAAVTRGQDQAEKASISSLIGATEGTMFVDILFTGAADNNPAYIQTWASQTERLGLFYSNSGNLIRPYLVSSGETDFSLGFTPTAGTRYKMAFCYKANDYAFFVNGSQVTIDAKAAVPTAGTKLFVGCLDSAAQANRQFSNINQALLFTSRLSNADLAALTA